jgi:two-component system, NarL family, sensor histidine kinase UhpB
MLDISQIEQLLASTGGGLTAVFDVIPDMVFIVDRDENVLYVNQRAARVLAARPEDVVGKRQAALFAADMGARHSRLIQQVFASGELMVTENQQDLRISPMWIDTRLVPIRDAAGAVVAVVGLVRDVTERRAAQRELELREAFLRGMLDNFPHMVWFKDVQGKFLIVNQAFADATGRAHPSELAGLTDFDVWPHELAAGYVADDQEVMRTGQQKQVEEQIRVKGELRWTETFKSPVVDADGKVIGTTGLGHDITERRRLQEEQRQSREQLRALAAHVESVREQERLRIAREIHDELGQSLTCMGMDLAFLDKQIDPANQDAVARVAALVELVKDTIRCVRRISSELRPSILDDLGLGAAIEWLAHDVEAHTAMKCTVEVPEDLSLPFEVATPLFRICQEALTNVTRHAQATEVTIRLEVEDGQLCFVVRDNGRGITDEEIRRHGSLGLLGMKERVALLGGTLEVEGRTGEGTILTVRMPVK